MRGEGVPQCTDSHFSSRTTAGLLPDGLGSVDAVKDRSKPLAQS
jgi:hypothetical protein